MKISVHIHSAYSMDARQTVPSILEQCRRLGYDAIAITDHNTVAGSLAADALLPKDINIIVGAEFSTEKGHILALFIDETIEQSCAKRGDIFVFDDLVSKVRAQGGLLFLAHPLQSAADRDASFIGVLDGYELINARIDASHREPAAEKLSARLMAEFPGKVLIGGSDAHTACELGSVYMTSDGTDLREALLHPDTICHRSSSMTRIRFGNIVNNRKKGTKFYCRQVAALAFGLFHDLAKKTWRDSYDVIRVRQEA